MLTSNLSQSPINFCVGNTIGARGLLRDCETLIFTNLRLQLYSGLVPGIESVCISAGPRLSLVSKV